MISLSKSVISSKLTITVLQANSTKKTTDMALQRWTRLKPKILSRFLSTNEAVEHVNTRSESSYETAKPYNCIPRPNTFKFVWDTVIDEKRKIKLHEVMQLLC